MSTTVVIPAPAVIPAKAGIHFLRSWCNMDPRFRGDDKSYSRGDDIDL
jgi:hypothetical protein